MRRALLTSILACLAASCVQTTVAQRAHPKPALIPTAHVDSFWEIEGAEGTAGWVVYFRSDGNPADSFYSVRNPWHQELGIVTSLGVAWKYHPHSTEAEHVSTGTLRDGVVAILDTSGDEQLVERPIAELAAAYGPSPFRGPSRALEAASSH